MKNSELTKSKYLFQPDLAALHSDTIEWLSDLEFCKTEFVFLSKLLNKYFLRVRGAQKLKDLQSFENKLKSFRGKVLRDLFAEIKKHESHIASLDENMFSADEQAIREEHKKYTTSIKAFMGTVRKLKKELFDFVEREMKTATPAKRKNNQLVLRKQPKALLT